MRSGLLVLPVVAIALASVLSVAGPADAQVVLSNRPWTNAGGWCLGNNGNYLTALRFTVPAGYGYSLDAVTVKIHEVVGGIPAQMDLHDDAFGATQPGNVIVTLGTQNLGAPGSFLEYTFPGGGNQLAGGMSYWVSVRILDPGGCSAAWDWGTPPTGNFTYSTTVTLVGGPPIVDPPADIEIEATALTPAAIPALGPFGLLLLALSLGLGGAYRLHRLRRCQVAKS